MTRNDGHSTNTPSTAAPARDGGGWSDLAGVREHERPRGGRSDGAFDDDDDDFDPRLMDLDEEEESPFLRAQKRVPVRRGAIPRKAANRIKQGAIALTCVGVMLVAASFLYSYGAHSWRFRVESSDDVDIAGVQNIPRAQVMEIFGADLGPNVFF